MFPLFHPTPLREVRITQELSTFFWWGRIFMVFLNEIITKCMNILEWRDYNFLHYLYSKAMCANRVQEKRWRTKITLNWRHDNLLHFHPFTCWATENTELMPHKIRITNSLIHYSLIYEAVSSSLPPPPPRVNSLPPPCKRLETVNTNFVPIRCRWLIRSAVLGRVMHPAQEAPRQLVGLNSLWIWLTREDRDTLVMVVAVLFVWRSPRYIFRIKIVKASVRHFIYIQLYANSY